jgi:hypothetical protein
MSSPPLSVSRLDFGLGTSNQIRYTLAPIWIVTPFTATTNVDTITTRLSQTAHPFCNFHPRCSTNSHHTASHTIAINPNQSNRLSVHPLILSNTNREKLVQPPTGRPGKNNAHNATPITAWNASITKYSPGTAPEYTDARHTCTQRTDARLRLIGINPSPTGIATTPTISHFHHEGQSQNNHSPTKPVPGLQYTLASGCKNGLNKSAQEPPHAVLRPTKVAPTWINPATTCGTPKINSNHNTSIRRRTTWCMPTQPQNFQGTNARRHVCQDQPTKRRKLFACSTNPINRPRSAFNTSAHENSSPHSAQRPCNGHASSHRAISPDWSYPQRGQRPADMSTPTAPLSKAGFIPVLPISPSQVAPQGT